MSGSNPAVSINKRKVAPVVLAILDGWGYREEIEHNAVRQASTPVIDALWHAYPHTLIEASGADVGLPDEQMGNSEVGHLTIGAGRIIQQELVRISNTVKENKLITNPALNQFSQSLKKGGGTLHIMGLCSDGGVHSHINHLCGLIEWAASKGLKNVSLHLFTDGRDTSAKSATKYINTIEAKIKSTGVGEISSLCGRYWSMDRDNRWERTSKAYELLTDPRFAISKLSAAESINKSYQEGITDEFIEPVRLSSSFLKDGDGVVFFNFRPDRARQLVKALKLKDFDGFERKNKADIDVLTFTQYESGLPVSVAFPPEPLNDLLGQVISDHGLNQYRTAETEKYPHVTYFLNGGIEKPLKGEVRHLVPSPRVATYDLQPEMSADELTESCIKAIHTGIYSLVVINFANPDMVGHSGIMTAAIKANEKVDSCVGKLLNSIGKLGGSLLITADHGNSEMMIGPDGQPWTAHTTNPVPVILIEGEKRKLSGYGNDIKLRESGGGLADLAPTLLHLLNLPKPKAMTGKTLIEPINLPKKPNLIPQAAY
ncbi:MAG: 2,3-bisphosphoglycerate-independent phosphoglycerate mutase [Prochlorococcus marinus]